ncbi:MAG TPA: class I SAM-dependent methyltransferase, partial [Actinoallomurus sp.]
MPETLLWNLYTVPWRPAGPTPLLRDPRAVELVDGIDYPFERFGAQMSQWHALRVLCFDREVRRFLRARPGGTVVG